MGRESVDLDVVSKSQVYRALRRAESDYGTYSRRSKVTNQRKITENWLENERFRSRTALATARISRSDYARLVKDMRAIANKEIKSSVGRSRRWSGKEVKAHNSTPTSHIQKLNSDTAKADLKEQQYNSPENNYHKTVCDILTNKGATSSYGHVAKILSRKANKKVRFDTNLPVVHHRDESQFQREGSSTDASRKQLDITLPSVLRNKAKAISTHFNNSGRLSKEIHEHHEEELYRVNEPKSSLPPTSTPLRFSNICQILAEDSLNSFQDGNEQIRWLTSVKKKQAQRAITGYYNKKEQSMINEPPKMMVIHLPNPNSSLESIHDRKRTPKLLLRYSLCYILVCFIDTKSLSCNLT